MAQRLDGQRAELGGEQPDRADELDVLVGDGGLGAQQGEPDGDLAPVDAVAHQPPAGPRRTRLRPARSAAAATCSLSWTGTYTSSNAPTSALGAAAG